MEVSETRYIELPQGGTFEVAMTGQFMKILRDHFHLEPIEHISDEYIRMYIFGAVKTALDKAESK